MVAVPAFLTAYERATRPAATTVPLDTARFAMIMSFATGGGALTARGMPVTLLASSRSSTTSSASACTRM